MEIYVVKSGDSVDTIARQYNMQVEDLVFINQINYPYALAIGQALLVGEMTEETAKRMIRVNGYAYPFIAQEVLTETLPFLTELSVFSYGFTMEGALIPPMLEDQWMINEAYEYGVSPTLTLTPLGEDGRFSNARIHALVNDASVKERLTFELLEVLEEKGYRSVDVDFEYILPEDRDAFTTFVRELTEDLNEQGYEVSVALAPKVSADQPGLLYEGKDYGGLGAAANRVLLMTYEWGYT